MEILNPKTQKSYNFLICTKQFVNSPGKLKYLLFYLVADVLRTRSGNTLITV